MNKVESEPSAYEWSPRFEWAPHSVHQIHFLVRGVAIRLRNSLKDRGKRGLARLKRPHTGIGGFIRFVGSQVSNTLEDMIESE
jgi:hypothetical protein